ncbi:NAD(+) hydrolase sarm1 isoform X4 [Diorhabda carinulata]|uniref:NAD(+) hydrolase sarm1 isoform X4 n=1 Tax=Diorhabda carinulata TaxID=1163345 RepID=UPI0025A2FC12|nr:NAD(+) hydrolase sarm1 isoform X4 [Diorhabda carinulata]
MNRSNKVYEYKYTTRRRNQGIPSFKERMSFFQMASESPTDNSNGNEPTIQTIIKNPSRSTITTTSLQTNSQSSTTTTTRVSKTSTSASTSQRRQITTDTKASNMKNDLVDFKNNINDMKSSLPNTLMQLRNSLENLVDSDEINDPIVTFPDDTPVPSEIGSPTNTVESLKYEQKTMNNFKKTTVMKDGISAEKESAKVEEMKKIRAGEISYEESNAAAATRARIDIDGITAQKSQVTAKEARSLKAGELSQQESKNMAQSNMKVTTDKFSSERSAMESQQQRQTVTASGFFNQEKKSSSSSHIYTSATKGLSTTASMINASRQFHLLNSTPEEDILNTSLEDLESLSANSDIHDIERAKHKYSTYLDESIRCLQKLEQSKDAPLFLDKINDVMRKAWAVPTYGHELGYALCNTLRNSGGLDLIMQNCTNADKILQFASAKLLEQCLTAENRAHVVEHGLDRVVNVACVCTKIHSVDHSRVGTGILEHLFKHSEETCSDVVRLGGLDALLFECRKSDIETLRHCAGALANLSLYGGAENQEAMIKRKVPMWLFPLAFHNDDNIKYYACLAITVLVANPEIEAEVLQSGTLGLVEPFVTSHNPSEFAKSNLAHAHGQSKTWLKNLVPVLSSKREEARNLAAFHFCMEAGIKKQQGNTSMFSEIGAIECLKKVASCPNAVASKYAAQALRLIGEEVPHKLSQQVPLWSAEDVEEWVKQIGFPDIAPSFMESRVDGDLLLQLTEENLKEDIGLTNGIKRKRFTRELQQLKKMADYSSRDTASINTFLQALGPEFSIYTYSFLNAGVEKKDYLRNISEDQLLKECGISNSIHRYRIMEGIRQLENGLANGMNEDNMDKSLDVFVSYRRSNGSQLASLLKVHLQLRGFSVFIDVERLEAGKFDNNLLQSIQKAKHFLLVLTPNALERCVGDHERKDWVHREICAALSANCNIIPIIDNFVFPEPDDLPEDMRQVCHFNAVRWIHDYQDACVDKLERFMRGETNTRGDGLRVGLTKGDITPGTPSNPGLVRQPPNYQRMHSNDSGSGKSSDKDVNGNSGLTRD